ncbi:hypothetical protein CKO38_02750 [Rhodospirillum rubrum]|uniref:leucine zipper domain-containing protein n=1 Tax=Rhodospirillum rubrum TaxID=1085 RepID=UPI00190407CC|nr:hypothetical protein [Rhodospirillum rubrum]MBK1675610.1 hypothetical protein [Rhodospirillum rubrum]
MIAGRHEAGEPPTVYKWLRRFRTEGEAWLLDRSYHPYHFQTTETPDQVAQIDRLRRQRMRSWRIAVQTRSSRATVARRCRALGLGRFSALTPKEPMGRYEREAPVDMIHIDIKRLGRLKKVGHRIIGKHTDQSNNRRTGWQYIHLAIDDHSRLAYSEILPDEKRSSCLISLFNALRFFGSHGIKVYRFRRTTASASAPTGMPRHCEC